MDLMPVHMSSERFEELVADALDEVPEQLMAAVDNVAFLIEEEPPDGSGILGLYEGVPLTERTWGGLQLPDRIYVFRGPLLRMCSTEGQVAREVRVTVIHEIAHHFGIDDDRLHDLGWA